MGSLFCSSYMNPDQKLLSYMNKHWNGTRDHLEYSCTMWIFFPLCQKTVFDKYRKVGNTTENRCCDRGRDL